MGKMADRTDGKIMVFCIQYHGQCIQRAGKSLELLDFFTGYFFCGSKQVICVFQHIGSGIGISGMLRSAHGMPADKMSLQIIGCDPLVDLGLDASHICDEKLWILFDEGF